MAPYDKINHRLVNVSSNCDVKSGLSGQIGLSVCNITRHYRHVEGTPVKPV